MLDNRKKDSHKFFYQVHVRNIMIGNQTFQFVDDDALGRFGPVPEVGVRTVGLGKLQQSVQVETVVADTGSALHGIVGIAFLFDVCRDHHEGFTQVHGFAD